MLHPLTDIIIINCSLEWIEFADDWKLGYWKNDPLDKENKSVKPFFALVQGFWGAGLQLDQRTHKAFCFSAWFSEKF